MKKKEKVPGFFHNLKQMNPFARKQPKERDPEAPAAAVEPAAAADEENKEESKELLEKEEKGDDEKGDDEEEKKDEGAEKMPEGEITSLCT